VEQRRQTRGSSLTQRSLGIADNSSELSRHQQHPHRQPTPSASHPTTSSLHTRTHILANMDSLVAQYSRPAFAEEGQTEEEQLELYGSTPGLSLKFALPPVAQVGFILDFRTSYTDEISVSVMAPRNDG
jgi:hypothetical protein